MSYTAMTFLGETVMDIIKIRNADYDRYEELLMQRDQLRKEADIYHGLYVREFGDLHLQIFEKQIACIRKKKLIGYYQLAMNRGDAIDQATIDALINDEMENYRRQLQGMIDENAAAKQMSEITSVTVLKIKRLYRKLAKQLHPDINPKTGEIPELMELWNMITTAYNTNSLKDMEEAEVLVNKALERIGMGCMEIEIPNLEAKIEEAEADIKRIRETDPYQYKYLLEDPDAVEEKKRDLKSQIDEYGEYEKQLDAVIEQILSSGVKIIWKMD